MILPSGVATLIVLIKEASPFSKYIYCKPINTVLSYIDAYLAFAIYNIKALSIVETSIVPILGIIP